MVDPYIHSSDYWLRWQVLICGLIILIPSLGFIVYLLRRKAEPLYSDQLWKSQWKKLSPRWLLCYRALAFVGMTVVFAKNVSIGGARYFYFYTQWTLTLVTVYFGVATTVSAYGCLKYSHETSTKSAVVKSDVEEGRTEMKPSLSRGENENKHKTDVQEVVRERAGFGGNLMQIMYQVCAGASVLTDIVNWCILVPLYPSPNGVNTMGVLTHSLNLILLILDTLLNSMPFPCFRIAYFVMWSSIYVAFQWVVHGCCISWWPYNFLDLNTWRAPLWYLALTVAHMPFFGMYSLITRAKNAFLPRLFPRAFVRLQ